MFILALVMNHIFGTLLQAIDRAKKFPSSNSFNFFVDKLMFDACLVLMIFALYVALVLLLS